MPSLKQSYKYLVLLCLLLYPTSCSVEKNTGASRFYHSLTARFNIYFNGYESFKAGLIKINNGYNDDYAEILKVFEYSDPATPSLCSSDMESAIQKASKLISLKSITSKPEIKGNPKENDPDRDLLNRKEYNEWVDDSYLLIGKARFYKHEYSEASDLFNYCISQANDGEIRQEASIWLSRINSETGKYSDSYRILSEMEITASAKRLRAMYYTSLADLFIKQKKYAEAIEPLAKAIDLSSGKRTRYRFTYLLAQLNEQAGNSSEAISLYRSVVKMNPPYEVEFNARINIAGVFDINSENPQRIRKELERMLNDSKNKDYLDQIYFALGNLSMKEGNEAEALDYYIKSAASPSSNQNQKGRSYLALADYYYKKPDLMQAGKFYDSTVFFLNQKHPDFLQLQLKSQNLNSVVSQLIIIQHEDSLQKVAAMSEQERTAFIQSIISKTIEAEKAGINTGNSDRFNLGQYYENERRFQGNIEQEGKWYFYNQAALAFGRTEFRRRYGERKLEENWRRSNKARITSGQALAGIDERETAGPDTSNAVLDNKKTEFYLKDLPLTDSLLTISNGKVANAYLNAGKAYDEKIMDPAKATEILEKLLTRFPSEELVPEALYKLYTINKDLNNAKAETYRQRLLEKHPDTEYARILSDPGYFEKKMADTKIAERLYEEAYLLYSTDDFNAAIAACDDAVLKYSQDILVPKFFLLRSYSIARISDERTFKEELGKIIKQWPGTEEAEKAGEIIAFLNQKLPELLVEEEKLIAEELFTADTTDTKIFALIIPDPALNINQATFDVISYNIDNFTNKNYRTEGTLTDSKYVMITVGGFQSHDQAMDYYNTFRPEKIIRNPSGAIMYTFVISRNNLNALIKDKNPDRYLLFFKENYPVDNK